MILREITRAGSVCPKILVLRTASLPRSCHTVAKIAPECSVLLCEALGVMRGAHNELLGTSRRYPVHSEWVLFARDICLALSRRNYLLFLALPEVSWYHVKSPRTDISCLVLRPPRSPKGRLACLCFFNLRFPLYGSTSTTCHGRR